MNFSIVLWVLLIGVVGYGLYSSINLARLIYVGKELSDATKSFVRSGEYTHNMLVVGDSTAAGVGTVPGESVPGRVAMYIDASAENYAVSGARLSDVVDQFKNAKREQYDLILIQAGANDIFYFTSAATVRAKTREMLALAAARGERIVVLTSGDVGTAPLWPFPLSYFYSKRTQAVRAIIQEEVGKYSSAVYVDLFTKDFPTGSEARAYYAPDNLHLTGKGYGIWATHVQSAIADTWPELLKQQ